MALLSSINKLIDNKVDFYHRRYDSNLKPAKAYGFATA